MSKLNLHLGDNADFKEGEFADATYVGLRVSLPLRMSNPGTKNQLIIRTSAIETLRRARTRSRNACTTRRLSLSERAPGIVSTIRETPMNISMQPDYSVWRTSSVSKASTTSPSFIQSGGVR